MFGAEAAIATAIYQQVKTNNMSLPTFKKKNVKSTKGLQSSKYDALISEFTEEGDTLTFDEDEVSKQTASNIAKRLTGLSGNIFHSFYDKVAKTTNVRRRLLGEVPSKEDEEGEEDEDGKSCPPDAEPVTEPVTEVPVEVTEDDPFGLG